ncbi:hypothetical protein IPM19_01355 [bacterium]|nr:MAG: hypothetical protein IPM19_01355 [bacterium]
MIKDIINKALADLNINDLQEAEQYQVMTQLTEHFNQIAIDTVIANLNDEQLAEFKSIVSGGDPEKLEDDLSVLVAKIPAIDLKLEEAINSEIAHIKASKAIMDK